MLLESKALDGRDTSSVLVVMFGGSSTPSSAVLAFSEVVPNAVLLNGYGLTEGGGSICVMPPGEATRRPGSVGRPMDGVQLRVVDPAGGPVETHEVGEIVIRVPGGERRYWGDPTASGQTWRDGWLHTGDLGRIDAEGFLFVVDRAKDVIVRGGYNVASAEVEAALHEHPAVAECAVVGVAHPTLGQEVAAVIRQVPGSVPLTAAEVRAHLEDRIADYKQPRHVVVTTDPLPRNSAGKVDKPAVVRSLS
jgi:long-chain acyl-CoA synthetase